MNGSNIYVGGGFTTVTTGAESASSRFLAIINTSGNLVSQNLTARNTIHRIVNAKDSIATFGVAFNTTDEGVKLSPLGRVIRKSDNKEII